MDTGAIIFSLLIIAFLAWGLYQQIKYKPELFSKQNILTSARALGMLTLFLIAVIWFCVMVLRS